MTSKIKTAAIATVIVLATATGALAQAQSGGVTVGSLTQVTVATDNNNVAFGRNAAAQQRIGTIQNTRAGRLTQVTIADGNNNVAFGRNARARQDIGSIGR